MTYRASGSALSHTVRLFALASIGLLAPVACSSSPTLDFGGDDGGSGSSSGGAADGGASCVRCLGDSDCGGGVCAQFAGDSYCATTCPTGNECSAAQACTTLSTSAGAQTSACVPRGGTCGVGSTGASSGGSGSSSGSSGGSGGGVDAGGTCGALAAPTTPAGCMSCTGSSSKTCAANGCYGGWYCNTQTNKCQSPPTSCPGGSSSSSGGGSGSGSGGNYDGGAPTGTVGPSGGSLSRLYFVAVGDTRPPNVDDTSGYPTAIATKIYQDIEAFSPRPAFGVSTGDYMYATPGKGQATPQLNLYLQARGNFTNVMFPTMGNHECTGYTASNCGQGNPDGVTENYTAFLTQLLKPLSQSSPYYAIHVNDTAGVWTAKFLFVAGNAWTTAQSNWLDGAMAQKTTYTFLIRHEPASAGGSSGAPGVDPAEAIMKKYPYTLSIVGHSHTYQKSGAREVIIGNGGAPLSSGSYGFGLLQQRSDGAIQVDMFDYQSVQPDSSFRFAVNPDGSAAAP